MCDCMLTVHLIHCNVKLHFNLEMAVKLKIYSTILVVMVSAMLDAR